MTNLALTYHGLGPLSDAESLKSGSAGKDAEYPQLGSSSYWHSFNKRSAFDIFTLGAFDIVTENNNLDGSFSFYDSIFKE